MSYVLGIHTDHDLGACLLHDGRIAVYIEEERLTRIKHGVTSATRGLWSSHNRRFGYVPWSSIRYCLDAEGIVLDDVDVIVLPETESGRTAAELMPVRRRDRILHAVEPTGGAHHFAHALTAFFASPFERAAVLVVDGDGTVTADGHESETGYVFERDDRGYRYREVFKNRYRPHVLGDARQRLFGGLGWMYEYVSAILGFVNTHVGFMAEPGKTMGLAPYGRAHPELETPWIDITGHRLDFSAFRRWLIDGGLVDLLRFDDKSHAWIRNEHDIPAHARDLAWKAQAELERAYVALAEYLRCETGEANLGLAGGVALNSVANGLLARRGMFERVFAQPAAADNGQAIGLAYYGYLTRFPGRRIEPVRHAFGGRRYGRSEIVEVLDRAELVREELADDTALAAAAADDIAAGRIIGWFQGGSEYGPRALGHRSILANPCVRGMKDRLNHRVKFREPFRPFAPAVPVERANEIFELPFESPFMLFVAPVREAYRERIPEITHVDGSARVQTVAADVDPRFHTLLCALEPRIGIPVVLNTSFNLRGMPIVETPLDALACFIATEMDALYLDRFVVRRPTLDQLFASPRQGWLLRGDRYFVSSGGGMLNRYWYPAARAADDREHRLPDDTRTLRLLAALDGTQSLAQALELANTVGTGGSLSPEAAENLVRKLVRARILALRVGELVLP